MLPELPKQNKQEETKASLKFRKWIIDNPRYTSSIEMKDSRSKTSIRLSEITDEQVNYALAIQESEKGVLIRTTGVKGLPDYIYIRKEPAYFCIKYPKGLCLINVNQIINEKKKSKSLSYSRAKDIAVISF